MKMNLNKYKKPLFDLDYKDLLLLTKKTKWTKLTRTCTPDRLEPSG